MVKGEVQLLPASMVVQGPVGEVEYNTSISQQVLQSGLVKLISYRYLVSPKKLMIPKYSTLSIVGGQQQSGGVVCAIHSTQSFIP